MSFLMKVDEQYGTVKTNILMLPELPHVSTAYRMLFQEQKHKEIAKLHHPPVSDSMAFNTHRKPFFDKIASRFYKGAGADSHRSKTGTTSKRPSSYFCDHCKVNGHSMDRCFKLHGYPPGFKRKFAGCVQETDAKTDLENLGLIAAQLDSLVALLHKHKDSVPDAFYGS